MRFAFNEEQEALRAAARSFLVDYSSPARVRQAMVTEAGYDPEVWRRIGAELGWTSIIVPEAYGGAGLGWGELGGPIEEVGGGVLGAPARRHRGTERGASPRRRRRRHDRDPRPHRARRTLGRVGHRGGGDAGRRRLRARRGEALRPRRPHGQPPPRGHPAPRL